jgi:hypothetical protein
MISYQLGSKSGAVDLSYRGLSLGLGFAGPWEAGAAFTWPRDFSDGTVVRELTAEFSGQALCATSSGLAHLDFP